MTINIEKMRADMRSDNKKFVLQALGVGGGRRLAIEFFRFGEFAGWLIEP